MFTQTCHSYSLQKRLYWIALFSLAFQSQFSVPAKSGIEKRAFQSRFWPVEENNVAGNRFSCTKTNQAIAPYHIQWNLDNSNCRGPPKKFELWVMLFLCFSHEATVVSQFRSSVFHFLGKLHKICAIFSSCEKKTMKLSLSHKNVNTSSHRNGNLMALTAVHRFEL